MKNSPLAWLLVLNEAVNVLTNQSLHVKSHVAIALPGLELDVKFALSVVRSLCVARVERLHGLVLELIHGGHLDGLPPFRLHYRFSEKNTQDSPAMCVIRLQRLTRQTCALQLSSPAL